MGRERVLFKSEEKKSRKEVADVMRAIADKVEQGKLMVSSGGQGVELEIPQSVVLEIKVEEEEKQRKKKSLEIEIEWYEGDVHGAGSPVKIG